MVRTGPAPTPGPLYLISEYDKKEQQRGSHLKVQIFGSDKFSERGQVADDMDR